MQEKRLAKLEAQLEGSEKVLAWMHRQQQLGGFVELVTRDAETNGASSPPLKIEDVDSAFIHECVGACNIRVLELQEAQMEKALLLLSLKRFLRTCVIPPEELEIKAFRQVLKVFVLKGMLVERAVKIIVEEHFSGLRILYDDMAEGLTQVNQTAQRMCAIFNEELAPAFGVEPITPDELEEYLVTAAPREAEIITTLARAKAEFAFGNRFKAYPLIAKAIRQSA